MQGNNHYEYRKCSGFTPTAVAKGSKSGTRTIIAELASKKHPAISRSMFISRRTIILLLVAELTKLTRAAGTPWLTIMYEKAEAPIIMKRTVASL